MRKIFEGMRNMKAAREFGSNKVDQSQFLFLLLVTGGNYV